MTAQSLSPPTPRDASQPIRVLVAEDVDVNRELIRLLLAGHGYEVDEVENGERALEAITSAAYDVVLMDVQMPVMDGVQATRAIRAEEAASARPRTPIVALSANAFHHQISEYLSAGMDTHVAKPIDLSSLQAALEYVLAPPEPAALAKAGGRAGQ
jgi:CheY-like chemotaxis protein